MNYYVSGCVFTAKFPELSHRIQQYAAGRGLNVLRCCVPGWKVAVYEEKMPEGPLRDAWCALPHTANFQPGDAAWSLCHNCSNIIEESRPGVAVHSLWELIDQDPDFPFPDLSGMKVTLQDCWRAKDRPEEQAAVRSLLKKMHVEFLEARENHAQMDFCGATLYRPQVERNPKLAPKHYLEGAKGKFLPHTPEEQQRIMRAYCAQFTTDTVVCYCHYCLEGLEMGGVNARHMAQLLFAE